jgi:putative FmdB family regulatory protein
MNSNEVTMPLYEYKCRKCSKRFEQLLFGKEKPSCPSCHGSDLEKLVSTFAAIGGGSESGSDSFANGDFGGGDDGGEFGDSDDDSMGSGACGTCGDPRGPGSCAID